MSTYKEVRVEIKIYNSTRRRLKRAGSVLGVAESNPLPDSIAPDSMMQWEHVYKALPEGSSSCYVYFDAEWGHESEDAQQTVPRSGAGGVIWRLKASEIADGVFQLIYDRLAFQHGYLRCMPQAKGVFQIVEATTSTRWTPVPPNQKVHLKLGGARAHRESIIARAAAEIKEWDAIRAAQGVVPDKPLTNQTQARALRKRYFKHTKNNGQMLRDVDAGTPTVDAIIKNGVVERQASGVPHWCGMFAFYCLKESSAESKAGYQGWNFAPLIAPSGPRPLLLFGAPDAAFARVKPGDILGGLNKFNHHAIVVSVEGSKITVHNGNAGGGNAHESYALTGTIDNVKSKFGNMYCTGPSPACTRLATEKKNNECPAKTFPKWQCPAFHGPNDWNKR